MSTKGAWPLIGQLRLGCEGGLRDPRSTSRACDESILPDQRHQVQESLVTGTCRDDRIDRVDTSGSGHCHSIFEACAGAARKAERELAGKRWEGIDFDAVSPAGADMRPVLADVCAHAGDMVDHRNRLAGHNPRDAEPDPGDGSLV